MKHHIMLDLETMGTAPGSVITSIGACFFDPNDRMRVIDRIFHQHIVLQDSVAKGFTTDPSTILWWMEQSQEARYTFITGQKEKSKPVLESLAAFTSFVLSEDNEPDDIIMWGNGAAFDNVLLSTYYSKVGRLQPWRHWNDRCYRTMKNQHPDIKLVRTGVHHSAADDAVSQALHMQAWSNPGFLPHNIVPKTA